MIRKITLRHCSDISFYHKFSMALVKVFMIILPYNVTYDTVSKLDPEVKRQNQWSNFSFGINP